GSLCIWKTDGLKDNLTIPRVRRPTDLAVSPNGDSLAVLGRNRSLATYRNSDQATEFVRPFRDITAGITYVADPGRIAVGDFLGLLHLFEAETLDSAGGFPVVTRPGAERVLSVASIPTSSVVAAGTSEGLIFVYALGGPQPRQVRALIGHLDDVHSLAFHPSGQRMVSSSEDGTVRTWSLEEEDQPVLSLDHEDDIWAAAAQGPLLYTGEGDGRLYRWDLSTMSRTSTNLHDEGSRIDHIGLGSRAGTNLLVAVGEQGQWSLLDADSLKRLYVHQAGRPTYTAADIGPRGERILLGTGGGVIEPTYELRLHVIGKLEEKPRTLLSKQEPIEQVGWSSKGNYAAVSFSPGGLLLMDGTSLTEIARLPPEFGPVFAFSPNGEWLACEAENHGVAVFDVAQPQKPIFELRGHTGRVRSLRFSKDGTRLLSGAEDGMAKLWHLKARIELMSFRQPETPMGPPADEVVHFTGFVGRDVVVMPTSPRALVWRTKPKTP
ncbi:MAG: WD40 repeat domain-containing protein, partial [Verrucomicrobiota bacterium]